ncbi:MAG: hypothetical protein Q8N35_12705 [Methylococcaceae bacterium]|uniref:hypothetical protein n=1 Tax=Methylicorpusculum sp. TaxID=2713644 RepID=UPI00271581EC|nr:hypothetical protein [Methylicorpusculum sp.]MDO9161009.1 hypothetical protein [Methylococcaceae bacterium]MDZ4158120.1 hypothetical protein [Methylococcales bacterium]MDP2392911.1 hypothetical protein [Methylococcaceae bacterium]MDP3020439.1 hypothetical protein [Methylococcaceae bacterium]MDP3390924.1 hypothetical protein [Methylococcaceae bacterium]
MKFQKAIISVLIASGSLILMAPAQAATTYFSADFNSTDGGFTTSTVNPFNGIPKAGWIYGAAAGASGSGGWSTLGEQEDGGSPYEHLLTSQIVTLSASGAVNLSFDHFYDFEQNWDGGVVNISVNGGAFTQVSAASFTQNGYSGIIQSIDDWGYAGDFNNLNVFTGTTTGFITSQANLGNFNAGDTLRIQFRGGWDWNGLGQNELGPNWAIDNVTLTAPVPLPSAAWLFGSVLTGFIGYRRRKTAI